MMTNDMKDTRVAAEEKMNDKTARALLTKDGFDSDDVNKKDSEGWTPIQHYCCRGNLKMCRYLFSRGANCRNLNIYGWFPMFAAAANGHLKIVQWLYHVVGAHEDIRRIVTRSGFSPLRIALEGQHFDVAKWLILIGALAPHDDIDGGGIDDMVMRRDFRQRHIWRGDTRLPILSWAQDAVTTHDNVSHNVTLFLTGTIHRRPKKQMKVSLSSCSSPLMQFNGKYGILELITHYVAGTQQQLRTLRQLMDRLPALIADVPLRRIRRREEEGEDEINI